MNEIWVIYVLATFSVLLALAAGHAQSKAKALEAWLKATQEELFKTQNEIAFYRSWQHDIVRRAQGDKGD